MTRLLVVTHYFENRPGGIERVAADLAARLSPRGFEIAWAASGPAPEGACNRLAMHAWDGIERWLGLPYPIWSPRSLRRLWRAVGEADVVHVHDCLYLGSIVAALAARRQRKPLVVTQHVGLVPYRNLLLRAAMKLATHVGGWLVLKRANVVVFCSRSVQQSYSERVTIQRSELIANGVDLKLFNVNDTARHSIRQQLGIAPDQTALLFVGRFVEKKGLPIVRTLAERHPECTWLMIGAGPLNPSAWNLPNVRTLGSVPHEQMADYYRAADLLVLPSVGEGFPLVVQEAAACGTPALISSETAAALPGVEQVCLSAEPTTDAMDAVLTQFLADRSEAATSIQIAEFARQHWDYETVAERYAAVLREAAQRCTGDTIAGFAQG